MVMSVSPCTLRGGEEETLEGTVEAEREVREAVRDETDTLGARRATVRVRRGAARRWGRAMTNGMRADWGCDTELGPLLPENGRVQYGGRGGR
jgi:hypothetical protein